MIIVVTGAFGFIASNLIRNLNKLGYKDIIAVDNNINNFGVHNLQDCDILDFIDTDTFFNIIANGDYEEQIDYIFHYGALIDFNLEKYSGKDIMHYNYEYSSMLLEYAQKNEIPFIYTSTFMVYGTNTQCVESREFEKPRNVYAYSKFLFDETVRRYFNNGISSPIVGLRLFNVYGEGECYKDKPSFIWQSFIKYNEIKAIKILQLNSNETIKRDFIFIDDVMKISLFFFSDHIKNHEYKSGIFNCGTGKSHSLSDVALELVNIYARLQGTTTYNTKDELLQNKIINFIPLSNSLKDSGFSSAVEANVTQLREAGFKDEFTSLKDGMTKYIKYLYEKYKN